MANQAQSQEYAQILFGRPGRTSWPGLLSAIHRGVKEGIPTRLQRLSRQQQETLQGGVSICSVVGTAALLLSTRSLSVYEAWSVVGPESILTLPALAGAEVARALPEKLPRGKKGRRVRVYAAEKAKLETLVVACNNWWLDVARKESPREAVIGEAQVPFDQVTSIGEEGATWVAVQHSASIDHARLRYYVAKRYQGGPEAFEQALLEEFAARGPHPW